MIQKQRIIIIGSGISGLTIAAGLETSDFLLLEARDRIGGRVLTTSSNLDMGAAWLHGSAGNPLNKYLDQKNLIPVSNSNPWMHPENTPIKYLSDTYVIDASSNTKWRALAARIASMPGISIGKALRAIGYDEDPVIFSFIYLMEVWCGGSVYNIPTSFLESDEFQVALFGDYGGNHSLFKTGALSVVDALVAAAHHNIHERIHYNKVVVEVVYGAAGVEVYTQDGSKYMCEKLCITVPPKPLQNIRFVPPLDDAKIKALTEIKMGSYKKIQLEFDRADVFWGEEPMMLTCNPKTTGKDYYLGDGDTACPYVLWNNYMSSKNKPILEAVCPANVGWKLSGSPDDEIMDSMMMNLRAFYPDAPDPIA